MCLYYICSNINDMMLADTKFKIKDKAYLTTDIEQKPRLVVGILIRETHIEYELVYGSERTWHYDFEVSESVNIELKTSN